MTKHTKMQEGVVHHQEKNQSIEGDPDEISRQNFKTGIISMFKM